MSSVIPYQSSLPPAAPSEFDFHFEREMARRLRRRVLWYCAITIGISLLMTVPILTGRGPPIQIAGAAPAPPMTHTLQYATSALSASLYIATFLIVWFKPLRREQILRLTLWLYVLASIPGLIGARLIFQMAIPPGMADDVITERNRERDRKQVIDAAGLAPIEIQLRPDGQRPPATLPATQRAAKDAQIRSVLNILFHPAMFFAFSVPFIFIIHHTFVCLFIPWTLRQSLAPAIILMSIVAVILLMDLAGGLHWFAPLIGLPLAACMLVPGSAFCWWRYRGMRRDIRLTFDSERLRSIQAELNGAKKILESALPPLRTTGPVQVSYVYEPMRQIGGDLLFVHPPPGKDDAPVSVVLLDVTGHGIAAALSVNRLIGELERLFAESPDARPGDVLNALNRYVHFTMARHDMYLSAVAFYIDPASGTLSYASAGHPTAYLRRVDGTILELESTTMLLGIVDNQLFSPDPLDIPLQGGNCIIAYTDGASEARSEQTLEMLGMNGVRNSFESVAKTGCACHDWPAEIMRRVAAFRNSPPLDDTLLVAIYRI